MKKLFILLFLAALTNCYSQIILENAYPNARYNLRLVKLSASGYKYVVNDTSFVNLYNLNHSLFKSITIPPRPIGLLNNSSLAIYYISEELFNTNPADVEYFVAYSDKNSVSHCKVYDEMGNTLLSRDSSINISTRTSEEDFITFTPAGAKLIITRAGLGVCSSCNNAYVYSLPGTLPCHDCNNGVTTSRTENPDLKNGDIKNYPNPATNQTTIEYTLPQGATQAEIVVYNMQGIEMKRFKVDNTFNNLLISTSDIPAGTYYYQLQTGSNTATGKKMVIIK